MGHYDGAREEDYREMVYKKREKIKKFITETTDDNILFINGLIDDIDNLKCFFEVLSNIGRRW